MFKITWARISDKYHHTFVIVPNVHALFELYHILNHYGARDGIAPVCITVTNLDGEEIDMSKGLYDAAGHGTYSSTNPY